MNATVDNIKDMGQMKMAILGGTALVLVIFFMFVSLRLASPALSPVYMGMDMQDAAYVMQELDKSQITYEVSASGSQVMVPSDKVGHVRMLLAQSGLPSKGSMVGYEIFDKSEALGTSNFVLNINKLRALEGELGRTISSFSKIDTARVHLVVPKRELFRKEEKATTASVALKLRTNDLSKNEISSIRHLVATAVPGLTPKRITIVDNNGTLLARGVEDENAADVLAETAQEFRVKYEKKLKRIVESLLEQSLGPGKVQAQITADIDFDRVTINSETFDPEGQVPRSIQGIEEVETSNESEGKEVVSVGQNLPDANGGGAGGINNSRQVRRTDETTNFEISKTIENHIKESGTINRLSVAVLLDGTYAKDEDGKIVYTPRSREQLDKMQALVSSAIGFDEDRGDTLELVNMRFAHGEKDVFEPSPLDWLQDDVDSIIQTLVLGGVAVLIILLIVRPLVSRAITSSEAAQKEEDLEDSLLGGGSIAGQLPDLSEDEGDDEMISINKVRGGVKSSTYKRIMEAIEQNPDETYNVLRGWAFNYHD